MRNRQERERVSHWRFAREFVSDSRARRWLIPIVSVFVYVLCLVAQHAQWRAVAVPLGEPYLGSCSTASTGAYRCASTSAGLTAIVAPIRLKSRNDYTVTVRGRSLTRDPVHVYVDFYGAEYDADAQKGELHFFPGATQTHVLRWSSDLPPERTWLRLSSADAGEYEISEVTVTRASKVLARLRMAIGWLTSLLLLWAAAREDFAPAIRRVRNAGRRVRSRQPVYALSMIFAAVCLLLLLRVASFSAPIVFGDEMSYGLLAQSLGNAAVYSRNGILQPLPNQLFFDVYHLAALCGEAMLGFGRALNCVLFALALLPLYALARRFFAQREALLFAAIVLLLPNSSYTAFFMPESFYFLAFYVVAWAFFSFIAPDGRLRHAVIAGVSLAALSLIKPHGLTILLACNLTLLIGLCAWRGERRRILSGWGLLLLAFGLAYALLGISDAPRAEGPWLERTFGLYANFITNTLQVGLDARMLERLRLATVNNVGATLLLFGAPLAASGCWLWRRRAPHEVPDTSGLGRLHVFTGIALLCLLIGTIKFTAYIAGADPSQDPERLHERYYDFSFGLVLLCGYASVRAISRSADAPRAAAWVGVAAVVAFASWYFVQGLPALRPSWIDHATLLGVWTWCIDGFFFIAALGLAAALLVPIAPRMALRAYAVFLAFTAIGGFVAIVDRGDISRSLNEFDRCALALKALYGPRDLEHGLVISSAENMAPLFHVSFALRNNVTMRLLPPGSAVDAAALAPDAQWILAYGPHTIEGEGWDRGLALPAQATLYRRVAR